MSKMKRLPVAALLACLAYVGAQAEDKAADQHKAKHGGTILEVGEEAAHIEMVHDAKAGKVTLYIYDGELKNEVALKDAPKLNLMTAAGAKQVAMTAVNAKDGAASQFEATDAALKSDPLKGRIAITVKEKKFNVDIVDEHK